MLDNPKDTKIRKSPNINEKIPPVKLPVPWNMILCAPEIKFEIGTNFKNEIISMGKFFKGIKQPKPNPRRVKNKKEREICQYLFVVKIAFSAPKPTKKIIEGNVCIKSLNCIFSV